jgi:hypothetical protein
MQCLQQRPHRPYAIEAGLIEMATFDKPNSRLQKYRLTKQGRDLITKLAKKASSDEK